MNFETCCDRNKGRKSPIVGGSGGIRAMQWLFFNHFCTMPSLTGILLDPPLFALTSMSYSNSEAEKNMISFVSNLEKV